MTDQEPALKPHEEQIEKFIARLRKQPTTDTLFNLYHTTDPVHDARAGASRRRENLRRYLKAMREPRFALIGLCPGYRGARFTGVPFTDEAHLCIPGSCYDRSAARAEPWRERSATVVMDLLGARSDVVCFNAVPWHVHAPGEPLSNADPSAEQLAAGLDELRFLLQRLYPLCTPVSVGEVAREALAKLGKAIGVHRTQSIEGHPHLRHPAHGGEAEFRAGLVQLLGPIDE